MKKSTFYILVFVIILVIVFVGTTGFSLAKYTAKSSWNYFLESRGFYFKSDLLNGVDNVNNSWDGGKVYFSVENSLNDSLVSSFDISYTATCEVLGDASSSFKCLMNGSGSDTFSGILSSNVSCINEKDDVDVSSYDKNQCDSGGYTWRETKTAKDLYFEIESLNGEEATGLNVAVDVKSTKPYKKTLSSKFILNKSSSLVGALDLKYQENDLNNMLIVSNSYNEDKCVRLSWDSSKLRIDTDMSLISSYEVDNDSYINEIVFSIDKKNSRDFKFYKSIIDDDISEGSFTLIESNGC